MTTLILAQQKIFSLRPHFSLHALAGWFEDMNSLGLYTYLLLGFTVAAALTYIVSVYVAAHLGFAIQAQSREYAQVEKAVIQRELLLQQHQTNLAEEHKNILELMEKATEIKYLAVGTAPSYSMLRP